MDIVGLFNDYGIQYASETDRHYREGWVNTVCPFCEGNPGHHLGYNLEEDYFHCWRCGGHQTEYTIAALLGCTQHEAKTILENYEYVVRRPIVRKTTKGKPYSLPTNSGPLEIQHKRYLERRGFDPDFLERKWGLLGTGPISFLDGVSYKHSIIAQVVWDRRCVSFISRSISGKSDAMRYKTCMRERELIHHKDVLYGNQEAWRGVGICVEGVTDVWRLGDVAFATFGITYTRKQVKVIAQHFDRVAILYDPDPQASRQAKRLVAELRFRGVDAWRETLPTDPASIAQDEAEYIVKKIIS